MPATAACPSLPVEALMTKMSIIRMARGNPNPKPTALKPVRVSAAITTASPTLYFPGRSLSTSMSFSCRSEALQWPATLQEAQAETCSIRTVT